MILYSNDWQQRLQRLGIVLQSLRWVGLRRSGQVQCGIGASTWTTAGVPTLIWEQWLWPAWDPWPKSVCGSSWSWLAIIWGLYLTFWTSPDIWLTSLKRVHQIRPVDGTTQVGFLSGKNFLTRRLIRKYPAGNDFIMVFHGLHPYFHFYLFF